MCLSKIYNKIKVFFQDKDERTLFINIVLAFIVKGLSLVVSMFSMPLYIKYFNNNTILGVWYTILSLLNWIAICDLGLGNGLRNYFTIAYAEGNKSVGKQYIISTYISLTIIIVPIAIIGCCLIQCVDFNAYFKVSTDVVPLNTLRMAVTILFVGVCLNFILKTITSIIYSIQKASVNNVVTLISSLIPVIYICIAKESTIVENLIRLAVVHIFALNIPLLVVTIVVFTTVCKEYKAGIKYFDWATSKVMLGTGLKFFFAQISFMYLMSTNEIFIARLFSANNVVEYNAYYKVFTLIGSLFMLALTPLWSKLTKDMAQAKYVKVRNTNRFLYIVSSLALIMELLLIFILQFIFNIWLGENSFKVDFYKSIIFGLFGGLYIFNIVLTTVANSIGELFTQIVFYGSGSLLKFPAILIMKYFTNDWSVVVVYVCIILFLFCLYQVVWIEKKVKKLMNN